MSKRATTILLTLSTTVILVFGIWQTAFHWAWLERPYLLPGLLFLLPAALSVADIVRGIIQRTPANLFWSWLKHSFETYYILLVQIGVIPIAFLLFPAGFFLQIISLVGEGIRLFSEDLRLHADVVRMDERKPINLYADACHVSHRSSDFCDFGGKVRRAFAGQGGGWVCGGAGMVGGEN